MKKRKKRKVCVAIFSRANYGSIRKVLEKLKTNSKIELQILVGGSANIENADIVNIHTKVSQSCGYFNLWIFRDRLSPCLHPMHSTLLCLS